MQEDTYILHADVNYIGIGGIVSVSTEGQELPVVFFSRQLCSSEMNYSSSQNECLVVVDTIRQFEIHLVGKSFTLVTNYQALPYLVSLRTLNRRLTRGALFLKDFAFTIKYRLGKLNNNEGLSRLKNLEEHFEDTFYQKREMREITHKLLTLVQIIILL